MNSNEIKYFESVARDIGESIADNGKAGLDPWAKCYTLWVDCVEALGGRARAIAQEAFNSRLGY